jgi:hypothetical protein
MSRPTIEAIRGADHPLHLCWGCGLVFGIYKKAEQHVCRKEEGA